MRRFWRMDVGMKWFGQGACIAGVACANAQTSEISPASPPPVRMEQLQKFLEEDSSGLGDLAKSLLGGTSNANRFFYFPTRDEPATPTKWSLKYEDISFRSIDGTPLHGWFLPAKATPQPKGTVVFSHGNAGSIGHHLWFVTWLAEAGYNVFLYDYRGFGKSGGEVDRAGMIEDVKSAFAYVASRPDVDPNNLISYGHSLGGAKSVTAIAEGEIKGLRAIIIDGTFSSYQGMARIMGGELGASLITDEFSPKDYIKKITGSPVLVIHGDQDQVVPFSQGKLLFDLANEPKTLFEVKEGTHGNSLARDNGAYRKRLLEWLEG